MGRRLSILSLILALILIGSPAPYAFTPPAPEVTVATLPGAPSAGDTVWVTDATGPSSDPGTWDCTAVGDPPTRLLCSWDGAAWVPTQRQAGGSSTTQPVQIIGAADRVTYAGESGDWPEGVPTTVQDALDSVAVREHVTGPASAVDENVPIFDGTTGKLVKDSGYPVTADDVTDDAVESMTTAAANGEGWLSDGAGHLIDTDLATQSELDAAFAAESPWDAVGTWASYYDANLSYKETAYQGAGAMMCLSSAPAETGDPLDEWVWITSSMSGAADCDGGGADDMLGFCYAPVGYDSYDSTFHAQKIYVKIHVEFTGYLWNDSGAVVDSLATFKSYIKDCQCPGGTCDVEGESCTLTAPTTTDPGGGVSYKIIEHDFEPEAAKYEYTIAYERVTFLLPGRCFALYVHKTLDDTASIGDPPYAPDEFGTQKAISVSVREMESRADRPYLCNFNASGSVHSRCLDNGIVTNVGATGSQTLTLIDAPATPVPWCTTIINQAGASLTVTPDASDTIEGESLGSSISNATQFDKIQLCNLIDGFWSIMGQKGTW